VNLVRRKEWRRWATRPSAVANLGAHASTPAGKDGGENRRAHDSWGDRWLYASWLAKVKALSLFKALKLPTKGKE
jgi:hypothetical protein